jgi:uncharacterized protein (TIGR03437 family)
LRFLFVFVLCIVPALSQTDSLFVFEPNIGQFPAAVRFVRRSPFNFFYFTRDAVVLRNRVRIQIADLDPKIVPEGDSPTTTVYNLYQGSNPSAWRTNVRLFSGMRLANISPGVSAVFAGSKLTFNSPTSIGQIKLTLTVQPGADLTKFRLRVLNTGAVPFEGPGSIWFSGGNIPGVFSVGVQTFQNQSAAPVASTLKIESSDTLSVQIPGRDPALPSQVEITFPNYDFSANMVPPVAASDGNRYITSYLEAPLDFGEDGTLSQPPCDGACTDAVAARLDETGKPIGVTLFGGVGQEFASFVAASNSGVVVSGTTASPDFPLTSNAPISKPGSPRDTFLAFFDRDSGQLRNSTYAGIERGTSVLQQAVDSGRDVAIGGSDVDASYANEQGYLLRWRPVENRFVFSHRFDSPVANVVFDADSNLYFALMNYVLANSGFQIGVLDANGKQQGNLVTVNSPSEGTVVSDVRLLSAPNREVWAVYQLRSQQPSGLPRTSAARVSIPLGQIVFNRMIANAGLPADVAMTPSGNLKLLIGIASPTEATTPDAALVAACPDTNYFAIVSPAGQLVYASYVPAAGFDFAAQNQAPSAGHAKLSCIASTAGRTPLLSIAPGQLITLTGGGFGPAKPLYSAVDSSGMYPLTLGGFSARIGGVDAPIVAVARGLIAAQVPFEIPVTSSQGSVEVFENGSPLNSLSYNYFNRILGLFDTGDRDNALNLPALAALNQDGTVNSTSNPATNGSVVSLFGSGLGPLSQPLVTGGLNPAGTLSLSSVFRTCLGCNEIVYLGSAPGLSTSVIQTNVRLTVDQSTSGVHPHPVGVAVADSIRNLFIFEPSGVVFVK